LAGISAKSLTQGIHRWKDTWWARDNGRAWQSPFSKKKFALPDWFRYCQGVISRCVPNDIGWRGAVVQAGGSGFSRELMHNGDAGADSRLKPLPQSALIISQKHFFTAKAAKLAKKR